MEYTKERLFAFKKKQEEKADKRADDGDAGGGGFGGFGVSEVCFRVTIIYAVFHLKIGDEYTWMESIFVIMQAYFKRAR